MSTRTDRLPISPTNIVAVAASIAAAALVGTQGNWVSAAILLAAGAYIAWAARLARRPDSTDLHRINAIEYRDERDRALAKSALATVGYAGLAVCYLTFVVSLIIGELPLLIAASTQLFAIAVVWSIANARAVRRG